MRSRNPHTHTGFTLIELMIVIAIIAVIASIAIPNLMASRISTNEAAAIATLKTLQTAQGQFVSIIAIDDNIDGIGEYAFLAELSGAVGLNLRASGTGSPNPLDPPMVGGMFRFVQASRVETSGFYFQVYLPTVLGTGAPEGPLGGSTGVEGADWCENYWNVYAYPVGLGRSGNRAFCVNERGEVRQTRMDVLQYGSAVVPTWDAAYNPVRGNMTDDFGTGATAVDGNNWVTVQ